MWLWLEATWAQQHIRLVAVSLMLRMQCLASGNLEKA